MNKNIYSKLTPSAKDELNKLTDNFKAAILEKAFIIATERDTANREISLRDILEAQQSAYRLGDSDTDYDNRRKKRIMFISLSGAVYAISGIFIYLYQNNLFSTKNGIGLIIAFFGIILSISAYIFGQYYSKRIILSNGKTLIHKSDYPSNHRFEIVKRWQLIEELAKKSVSEKEQKEMRSYSVSYLIRFLSHKIAKDEEDFQKIRELLQLRNKIVHKQYQPNVVEINEFLNFADDLINRLESQQETKAIQKNKLNVIEARYGNPNKYVDATNELRQLVYNNKLDFIVNNEIVGDPDYGVPKHLIIIFKSAGVKQRLVFKEGSKVSIVG